MGHTGQRAPRYSHCHCMPRPYVRPESAELKTGFLEEVPQWLYTMSQQSTPRYDCNSVDFRVNGKAGVRLSDALLSTQVPGLAHAEEQVTSDIGPKVFYRIKWKGYTTYSALRLPQFLDHERKIFTRTAIAHHVAQVVTDFIQIMSEFKHEQPFLQVGPGFIELKDLYLLEVRRVDKNSWQPILAVKNRLSLWSDVIKKKTGGLCNSNHMSACVPQVLQTGFFGGRSVITLWLKEEILVELETLKNPNMNITVK